MLRLERFKSLETLLLSSFYNRDMEVNSCTHHLAKSRVWSANYAKRNYSKNTAPASLSCIRPHNSSEIKKKLINKSIGRIKGHEKISKPILKFKWFIVAHALSQDR